MEWISVKDKLPIKSNDECNDLLFIAKDHWDRIHTIVGNYYESEGYTETHEENNYRTKKTITTVYPSKKYVTPRCIVGKNCSEAEIPLEQIIYWMHLPERKQ